MSERLLQLDDVRNTDSPEKVANLFQKLGYNANSSAQQFDVDTLELPGRSAEVVEKSYLIADHQKSATYSLQVLLFQLQLKEWETPSTASNRMRAIAQSLCRRPSKFLLVGTHNYRQLMLVNPRTTLDAQMNVKTSIRKLLIDRINPTAYDRDRLEAISAYNLDPQALYNRQCDAFDVEKLTKEFYKGYKDIFEQVQRVIRDHNPHPYFDDPGRLHQTSQRLLGRVMFLYFLQKKEFLGGDRDFLKNQYRKLKPEPEDTDFYTQLLEPLFFEMLNKERPNFESPWGKIPYLNGGLFDRDYGADIVDAAGFQTPDELVLPNSLFDPSGEKGVIRFFNGYNFTISENVQGDEDVAVDPEMLGKVFENMLAAEERGQSGTFYTPRGIVHFMCVESLSRYLADESGIDLEVVKQLAEFDPDLPDADLKKLLTRAQTNKLKQALETVKVCDPAVGSGAFPLGMMQVILAVWQAIGQREGESIKRGSLAMSRIKRKIIANNLYGVDIKPEALEIAKLRMWLSMVVDIPSIDDVEPLPNLDYKLMAGNSLISTIAGEQLIPDPTKDQQGLLNVTPVQAAIQPLLDLQHQYFESHADERRELSKQIRQAEETVFQVAIGDRRQYWLKEQRKIAQDLRLIGKASKAQAQKQQMIEGKLKELDRIELDVARGLRSLDFFQWHLHFNDVFQEKGGFDVVIGNPPYVRQEKLSEHLKEALKVEFPALYRGTSDIYTYFYGRGISLLHSDGHLSFISSNKFMRATYGEKLRAQLSKHTKLHIVVDFGDLPVFDAAAYATILILQKQIPNATSSITTMTSTQEKDVVEISTRIAERGITLLQRDLSSEYWTLEDPKVLALLRKLESNGVLLDEYVHGNICYGVKTGYGDAFVVDAETRDCLISEDPKSAEIIKPYLRGRDIKRWQTDWQNLYLVFARQGIDIKRYPAIERHLQQFRDRLTPGVQGGRKAGSYKWYEIQDNVAYYREFEKKKIVYQRFQVKPVFAMDRENCFTNDAVWIYPEEDFYLLAYLNSFIGGWCISKICTEIQNGHQLIYSYFKKVPVPIIPTQKRDEIEALSKRLCNGESNLCLEAEINRIFIDSLNLTDWEIEQFQGEQH